MGVCLCKDKAEESLSDHISIPNGPGSLENIWGLSRSDHRTVSLSETVDRLVKETLEVIGTIVDK